MSRTSRARHAPRWYADLERGTGEAVPLPPRLRRALLTATARTADHQAQEKAAAQAAAARAADRHDPVEALRVFFRMLAVLIPVWALTPVVASLGVMILPNISTAVLTATENTGSKTGDAPIALYVHLAFVLAIFCFAIFAINLLFGLKVRHIWLVWAGGLGGFVAASYLLIHHGGAMWQWDVTPVALVAAYLSAQVWTTINSTLATRQL